MHQEATSQRCLRPEDETEPQPPEGTSRPSVTDVFAEAVSSRLFLMTTLGAATGQIPALAADGLLASPAVVLTVGLTVVAGVGAFLAAVEEASLTDARGRRVFGATALLSILVNVAAAGVGVAIAQVTTFEHLRYFAASALGVVAWEIGCGRAIELPQGVPAPALLVGLGAVVEVLA